MRPLETGHRIARARRRRGLSQAVLAGLVGRSESWLSQVERGKRNVDSHSVLTRLADVLRVDIGEITQPANDAAVDARRYPDALLIEQAMMAYPALEHTIAGHGTSQSSDIRSLESRIRAVHSRYQATRYEEAGKLLPALIRESETASRTDDPGRPDLCRLRACVYDTTAALLRRVGEHALAWMAADRAISAAEQSGQPLLAALSAYRLAYVLASRMHPRQAIELAMTSAAALDRSARSAEADPEQLSLYGGLHLAAASAAAADYDSSLSASLLRTARTAAERLGKDANFARTAFGPANVAIHTMSAAVRLGDWRTVVTIGESLDATRLPTGLIGRRAQVNLDLARAYGMRRQDAAAVNALLTAEQFSPQLIRFNTSTHELINGLLQREHRASTPQLRPLAHRAGLV